MKNAAEISSGFINIGSAIRKLIGAGGYTDSMEIAYTNSGALVR
jgi:hypothetical protein